MGVVGQYDSIDFRQYPPETHVIVRTERGLESGFVICELDVSESGQFPVSGQLLRQTSAEDLLILERLERYRDKAFDACERLITQRGLSGLLIDVEHTFDGESVYFYFMGEITAELEALTQELGEVYERKVRFRKFSETLAKGCGPNCGTAEGSCSPTGCSSCSLVGGCGKK
jgi:cell fate regulator YaaT (PSP1 superfamily)